MTKKDDLLAWVLNNEKMLYAAGTTGKAIEEKLQQGLEKLPSGPLGGDPTDRRPDSGRKNGNLIFF